MDFPNIKDLKPQSRERLSRANDAKRIVTLYAGVLVGISLLITLINYVLELQIDQSGGLSNMGTRSILSTVQTVLPLVQSAVLLCLEVGYLSSMLRVARGQYTSVQSLRLGFDRFWVLLRCAIIKGMLYFAVAFGSIYLAVWLYMLTPLSDPVVELLMPLFDEASLMNPNIILDDATYSKLMELVTPAFLLSAVACCITLIPMIYQYRLVNYVVIDKPGMGALAALRESKQMMRRNRLNLLKVDLSLWLYHGGLIFASVVCYGDMLLPMLGIELPWSADVSFFLFYILYLAAAFGVYFFLGNRAAVTYGLVYESLKPEETKPEGVVLGNIFQM